MRSLRSTWAVLVTLELLETSIDYLRLRVTSSIIRSSPFRRFRIGVDCRCLGDWRTGKRTVDTCLRVALTGVTSLMAASNNFLLELLVTGVEGMAKTWSDVRKDGRLDVVTCWSELGCSAVHFLFSVSISVSWSLALSPSMRVPLHVLIVMKTRLAFVSNVRRENCNDEMRRERSAKTKQRQKWRAQKIRVENR